MQTHTVTDEKDAQECQVADKDDHVDRTFLWVRSVGFTMKCIQPISACLTSGASVRGLRRTRGTCNHINANLHPGCRNFLSSRGMQEV
jgi:hypothetical protein